MGYIDNNLLPGEQVLYRAKRHWVVLLGPLFLLALAALVGFRIGNNFNLVILLLILTGLYLTKALLFYLCMEIAVTNKRLLIKEGLVWRASIELLLPGIGGIQVMQSPLGRILGYGNILVTGIGGDKNPFAGIADPIAFRNAVQKHIVETVGL